MEHRNSSSIRFAKWKQNVTHIDSEKRKNDMYYVYHIPHSKRNVYVDTYALNLHIYL